MRVENEQIIIEGETEALAITTVLGKLDREANKGLLPHDQTHHFADIANLFEPPLPVDHLSVPRLIGRRILGRFTDDSAQQEHTLVDPANVHPIAMTFSLAVMPESLLFSGSRLGVKRYLRDHRMPGLFDYLRQVKQSGHE